MLEKEAERTTEPEPEINYAAAMWDRWAKMLEGYQKGKRVVKFKERKWQQNKQGYTLRYATTPPHLQDTAAPFWLAFLHRITKQSGKHTHQGGLPIFVIDGKGYSVVDGVRYDWKKGDLMLLPIKPGGVEHQHFNENPDKPAVWLAIRWYPLIEYLASTTKQEETDKNWRAGR